jgi:Tol biopolymer transport system component/DNA-binding winged helix-turn-helix (wHTH) protein
LKGDFHIADWEVQPQLNCIRRGDQFHHLEPKVMQVLIHLAAHSNEVMSKDRLIHAVWPDTFVGDDVLTRSISELRRAFDDDARAPRIIQTIPKAGYRIIAPVVPAAESVPATEEAVVQSPTPEPENPAADATPVVEPHVPSEAPQPAAKSAPRSALWIAGLVALILIGALVWHFWMPHPAQHSASVLRTVPFTSYPGNQSQPAFSPDGNQIAFVWNGSSRDNYDIYVKVIGAETPLRLTSDPSNDYSPVWSPDGRSIAFLRLSDTDRGIYVMPAIGGAARKIFTPTGRIEWERGALSWSPDGKRLIFPDGKSGSTPSQIFSLALDTLQAHGITTPPEHWDGDNGPVFSPDGSQIAFIRAIEAAIRDVYVMDADGADLHRVTFDNRFVESLAWDVDGKSIIFASDRGGRPSLWRLQLRKGATPERIEVGGEDATGPNVAAKGNRLAYSQSKSNWSIMRLALRGATGKAGATKLTPLLSSTLQDSSPHYSPDGGHIAFQSWRAGTQEIWICNRDGSSPVKLTSFDGPLTGSPSWSPDGTHIAFDARPDGHSHIFYMSTEGSLPKAATSGESNDIVPSWSHDGQWIYFGSNRSGSWQIWKVPSNGGEPQQVTHSGGFIPAESPDGHWLYYTKADLPGLWRVSVSGGAEEKILDSPRLGYWGYWSLTPEGVYYLHNNAIEFKNTASGAVSRILQLDHTPPPFAGITASPDGAALLYTDITEVSSNITLVEHFK